MASETPDRHVSAHYSTTSGHCIFSGCLYKYVIKRQMFGLKKEAVSRLFAMVKHGEGDYHFQCFVDHESTEAEYIYDMKSFSRAEEAKETGNYKFVFMIKFEDGDNEPLRLMCVSERERQQWIGEINDIIRDIVEEENSALSKDSGFGSGSSASKEHTGYQERDYSYVAVPCTSRTQQLNRKPQDELKEYSQKTNRRGGKRAPEKESPQKIGCYLDIVLTDAYTVNDGSNVEGSDEDKPKQSDINNGGRTQTTAKHISKKATQQQERPKCAARPKAQRHRGLPVPVKESQQETYCNTSEHTYANAANEDGSITTLRLLEITDDDRTQTTAKHLSNKATQQQERPKPAARPKKHTDRGLPVQVKESQQETYCNMNGIQAQADTAHDYASKTALKQRYIPTEEGRLLSNLDRNTSDGQESTYINIARQVVQPTDDERSWLFCRGPQTESEDSAHAEHRQ